MWLFWISEYIVKTKSSWTKFLITCAQFTCSQCWIKKNLGWKSCTVLSNYDFRSSSTVPTMQFWLILGTNFILMTNVIQCYFNNWGSKSYAYPDMFFGCGKLITISKQLKLQWSCWIMRILEIMTATETCNIGVHCFLLSRLEWACLVLLFFKKNKNGLGASCTNAG